MNVYIIAEIGSNFDSNFDQAIKLIDAAAIAGADAVKFQLFNANVLYPQGPKNVVDILSKVELPREWVPRLKEYSESCGLDFMASPFDLDAVDLLEDVGVRAYKIASSEVLNHDLLFHIAKTKKPVYLSTGMSSMADVAEAVEILDSAKSGEITLLHCSSVYPVEFHEVNLGAMKTLEVAFGKKIGFSDHTLGISCSLAAAALGATVIEKHYTLSRGLEGPDHFYALEPDELKNMVDGIRQVELATSGDGLKNLLPDEKKWGRLIGVHASEDIKAGIELTLDLIMTQRPAIGIPARFSKLMIGKRVIRSVKKGEALNWSDLEA